ncbi:response regulator transcription factor [Bowmanella dokdonensis]|uniref:Response regulator transcription factor n=1 Tax=Bowmanella dokdonensis TaxID=751969 RepID=A0A939IST6_9ALTE|nr:response regulator [Bowmanella dokdonensis]MBN7827072.1 response regulator transcription factor [Bowmanella dokdonensis]
MAIVYLVDDDELVLASLENLFRFAGYETHSYRSAKDFINARPAIKDSCLVLDLSMPQMSGLELQQQLQSLGLELPVIIYSGSADVASTVKAMSGGAYTLVQKPASGEELIGVVQQAIDKHKQIQADKLPRAEARAKLSQLSERERSVARLVACGKSASAIAHQLYISPRTVEAHKASIFNKLKIKSVAILAQLVVLSDLGKNANNGSPN